LPSGVNKFVDEQVPLVLLSLSTPLYASLVNTLVFYIVGNSIPPHIVLLKYGKNIGS